MSRCRDRRRKITVAMALGFTAPCSVSGKRAKADFSKNGIRRHRWATGEALAFCTLLQEAVTFRPSGQDSERGPRSRQRHSVLIDQETRAAIAVNHPRRSEAHYEVINSRCLRKAVSALEYVIRCGAEAAGDSEGAQFGGYRTRAVLIRQFSPLDANANAAACRPSLNVRM